MRKSWVVLLLSVKAQEQGNRERLRPARKPSKVGPQLVRCRYLSIKIQT